MTYLEKLIQIEPMIVGQKYEVIDRWCPDDFFQIDEGEWCDKNNNDCDACWGADYKDEPIKPHSGEKIEHIVGRKGDVKPDPVNHDPVNHPSHYTSGGVECIDAMEAAFGIRTVQNFCVCNAFKYVFRHTHKNGLEDIKKAAWYLDKYLKLEAKKNA